MSTIERGVSTIPTPGYAETAQTRLEDLRRWREQIPHFVIPPAADATQRLSAVAAIPPEFIELTNVAVANQTSLMRADGAMPAQVRDLMSYADAYAPLVDELEALAQFLDHSVTAARNQAATEALTTYALAQRLATAGNGAPRAPRRRHAPCAGTHQETIARGARAKGGGAGGEGGGQGREAREKGAESAAGSGGGDGSDDGRAVTFRSIVLRGRICGAAAALGRRFLARGRRPGGRRSTFVTPRRVFVTPSRPFIPRNRPVCAGRRSCAYTWVERRANMKRAMLIVAAAALCVAGSALADAGGLIGSGTRTEDSGQVMGSGNAAGQTVGSGGFTASSQDGQVLGSGGRSDSGSGSSQTTADAGGLIGSGTRADDSGLSVRVVRLFDDSSVLVVSSDQGTFVIPIE